MGLGWKIIPYEDSKLFFAEGSLFGFTSFMGIIPEKDIGIVILSNHVDKSIEFLAHQLLDIMSSF